MVGRYWNVMDEDGEETMVFVESDSTVTNIETVDMSKQLDVKFVRTHEDAVLPKANNT